MYFHHLQLCYDRDPEGALVQFSKPSEAKAAYSSTEAILNNRFIRVYYLRKNQPSTVLPPVETSLVVCTCVQWSL